MIVPEDEEDHEEDGNEDEGKQRESERIDLRSPCHTFTCGTLLCETHFCDVTHLTSHSALWEHPMLLCAFGNVYTWLTSFSSWVKLSAQGGRQTCHVGISLGILSPWPSPSATRLGACVGGGKDTIRWTTSFLIQNSCWIRLRLLYHIKRWGKAFPLNLLIESTPGIPSGPTKMF